MAKRHNQELFYVAPDVQAQYKKFKVAYPHAGPTAIINAALRFYLQYAKSGVDGNLQPYKIDASTNTYDSPRRVVWTDAQRQAYHAKQQ